MVPTRLIAGVAGKRPAWRGPDEQETIRGHRPHGVLLAAPRERRTFCLRGIAADASQTPHTCGGGGRQETSSALPVHAGLPSGTVANISDI
jgi:hypothetical protein